MMSLNMGLGIRFSIAAGFSIICICIPLSNFKRRLLRVTWTAGRSNQSILKEINPEYSMEGLMLKLKLQYFGHLMWRTDSLEKTLMLGKIEGGRRRGWQRMRWHPWLNGHEFEQAAGLSLLPILSFLRLEETLFLPLEGPPGGPCAPF